MVMLRGEVWWANLPPPVGSGPGGRRPVVIVQDDEFNQSRIQTIVIVIITSNLKWARARGNVFLPARLSGLEHDSVANVSQVLAADKMLLTDFIGALPEELMTEIDEGLRAIFGLY
jgi:mRNA interferase MazF